AKNLATEITNHNVKQNNLQGQNSITNEHITNNKNVRKLLDDSDLEDRLDAQFYWEDMDFANCIKLSKIAKVSGGKRLPKGFDYSKDNTNYRYLRIGNINWDSTLDYDNFKYISEELYMKLKHYEIHNNDLLLAIVGATIGKCSLLNIPNNDKIILTENCAKIKITDYAVLPHYLLFLLQSNFVQKQIQLNYVQTTLPKLGLDRVLSLYLPTFPSKKRQQELLDIYQSAFLLKKQKEKQAKDLLDSIDTYLLDELGITLQEIDNSLEKRIFKVNLSDISGGRYDAEAFLPYYEKIYQCIDKSKYQKQTLSCIVSKINRRFTAIENKEYDYIQLGSIGRDNSEVEKPLKIKLPDIPSRAQQIVKTNEILFSIANPQWGNHILVKEVNNNFIASSGFIILDSNENNNYITEILRSNLYKKLYEKYLTGSGLFLNISTKDLLSIKIPLPSIEKQNEIAKHIQTIRDNAKQLKFEATQDLENAKLKVEKMILGQ
ncbi:MAG: restriction endonuclease subunit S, partial [Campylobacterota bacterium]|nr:restriction endonuclease subunit S [Campylobacterota bacterium]